MERAALDHVGQLDDGFFDRRATPELPQRANHLSVDVVDLAVAALQPVLEDRRRRVREYETGQQRVEKRLDDRVSMSNVRAGEPEDRQDRVPETQGRFEDFVAGAEHDLAHRRHGPTVPLWRRSEATSSSRPRVEG